MQQAPGLGPAADLGHHVPAMVEDVVVDCPACGEPVVLAVDTTAGDEQDYVEDCPVCCRAMDVFVRCQPGTVHSVSVSAD